MDKKDLWKLNSSLQNDILISELISKEQISTIQEIFKDGFPVTTFVLYEMYYNTTMEIDDIKSMLLVATNISDDVKFWIAEYIDVEEIWDLFEKKPELATDSFPTDENCVSFKLWDVLYQRDNLDLIALENPDYLEKITDSVPVSTALLKKDFDKYADVVSERQHYGAFLAIKYGWKYLIDIGLVKRVLELGAYDSFITRKQLFNYCKLKGLIDELYNADFIEELLHCGEFDVFVRNHSFAVRFLVGHPEKVDWEDLWEHCQDKAKQNELLDYALINKDCQNTRSFLKKHLGFWGKVKLALDW